MIYTPKHDETLTKTFKKSENYLITGIDVMVSTVKVTM